MANYIAAARSNVFRVKDLKAFMDEVGDKAPDVVVEHRSRGDDLPGQVMMYPAGEYGDWPTCYLDEAGDDHEVDWVATVSKHLVDGEVCVMMEAGSEKLRYVSGWSCAIHSDGRSVSVSLNDIYEKASAEFGVAKESISDASY